MGTFKTSTGERLTKTVIDGQIRKAKKELTDQAIEDGMQYCWSCGRTNERLSCSHIISVNDCQNDGRSEQAYNVDNIQLECLICHAETERGDIVYHENYLYKKEFILQYYLNL